MLWNDDGEVILGLVYDPLRGECFKAIKGGAILNDAPMRIYSVMELDKALLATGFPYDQCEQTDFYLSFFKALMTRSRASGAMARRPWISAMWFAARIDGFWEMKLRPWDTAAGALIVEEAGGKLSDLAGNKSSIWGKETLASNGAIHDELVNTVMARHTRAQLVDSILTR